MDSSGGRREVFAPATLPLDQSGIQSNERLISMPDKCLEEEQVARVDERLARAVRIIVEQYDGDVRAFVESIRYRVDVIRRDEARSNNRGKAAWQHP